VAEGFAEEDDVLEFGMKLLLELDSGSFALEIPASGLELLMPVLELSVSVLELLISVWEPALSVLELLVVRFSVLELEFPCS
jgi:hypothetical protein